LLLAAVIYKIIKQKDMNEERKQKCQTGVSESKKSSKLKINKFLEELTIITQKYNICLDTTDDMFMTDDSGDIGSIKYDYNLNKYIYYKS
jgi:hypothetical protein